MIAAQPVNSGVSSADSNGTGPTGRQLPLIAVAGSAGKSTVAWMLSDIFARAGKQVAGWLSSGVYIDGDRHTNEIHAWERAILAARAREVDFLIQELSAALTLGIGLRPRSYQMGLVTTICGSDDRCHRGSETSREIEAVSRLMDAIAEDGIAVGNADDILIVEQMERTNAQRILFALNARNPALRHHLETGGRGAWVEQDWLVFGALDDHERVMRASDIAASYGGVFAFQIQNALAATCCAMAMGVDSGSVAASLRHFEPDDSRLAGRCNVLEHQRGTIVVDSPRLLQSVRGLCRGVRALGSRRTIAVMGASASLDRESFIEAARTIGSTAGVVILHGPQESRHLQEIRTGLALADAPPVVLALPNEASALDYLSDSLNAEDTALVITDHPSVVLDHLRQRDS